MNYRFLAAISTALAACSFARGQEDVLRGPSVPREERKTLVSWTMTGQFERVEGRPEAAAVQLLDLDEAARREAARMIDERNQAVGMLLVDRIEAVREITDATLGGERARAQGLLRELWAEFEPDAPRSPLREELVEVLSEAQCAEFDRLLDEYWTTWASWASRGEAREGETEAERKGRLERTADRLAFQLFQEEARAGYELTLRRYRDVLDALYEAVEPTEAQREAIRGVVIDHIKATRLKATPAERRASMHEVYKVLDDERRIKLFDYILRVAVPDQAD